MIVDKYVKKQSKTELWGAWVLLVVCEVWEL